MEGKVIAVAPASIRLATVADAKILERLSTETFHQTFAGQDCNKQVSAYMASAFSEEQLQQELKDRQSVFLLANGRSEPLGFAKLRKNRQPERQLKGRAIEMHRLYVLQPMIGKGIGSLLMESCLEIARRGGFDVMWLSVWNQNSRAIHFYRKWGFSVFDSCTFDLGAESQTDFLMKKKLL
jgi:diamine N-acetyltransferase